MPLTRPDKEPAFVAVKPATAAGQDDAEQKLLKATFNLALETFRQRYDSFLSRPDSVEALLRSARALRDARLELAPAVDRQIEIRKEYLEFTEAMEGWCEIYALACPGQLPRLSMEEYKVARMARLEAELDLLRAQRKARPPATE